MAKYTTYTYVYVDIDDATRDRCIQGRRRDTWGGGKSSIRQEPKQMLFVRTYLIKPLVKPWAKEPPPQTN